ncbi:unnamed protein product, partial [Prorocentrum cordatum]
VTFKMIDKSRSEEARGEFVRWALQERCMSVEELLEYPGLIEEGEEATMQLNPKLSGEDSLVFEEKVSLRRRRWLEGEDGGFGGSRKAFVKEHASGKQRHKRTEINKSLAKESKKRSKGGPSVF